MKKQNREIEYLKEKLEFALEVSQLGMWEFKIETHETIRTHKHDHIFGYPSPVEDWSYSTFLKHLYPADKNRVNDEFIHFVENDTEYHNVFRIVRLDKKVRWLSVCAKKIISKEGDEKRIIGLTKDITSDKKIRKKHKKIKNIFNLFADNIHMVLYKAYINLNKVDYFNREIETILGVSLEYLTQHPSSFLDFVIPEDRERVTKFHLNRVRLPKHNKSIEYCILRPDGEYRNIVEHIFPEKNKAGYIVGVLGTISDLTHVHLKRKLDNIQIESDNIIKNYPEIKEACVKILGMLCRYLTFELGEIQIFNDLKNALYRMTYSYSESASMSIENTLDYAQIIDTDFEYISKILKAESPFFFHHFPLNTDGNIALDPIYLNFSNVYGIHLKYNNEIIGVMIFHTNNKAIPNEETSRIITHIANQLAHIIHENYTQQKIDIIAKYDSTTGLPTKYLFMRTVRELLETKKTTYFAVMQLHLDQFHEVENVLGAKAVDAILKQFTERLANAPSVYLTYFSRLDTRVFGLILEDFKDADTINNIANELLMTTKSPFLYGKQEIFITASIGISIYPQDGQDEIALLSNASAALSKAIAQGGNCFVSWTSFLKVNIVEELQLNIALNQALVNNEFILYYQPKIDFNTGKVVGVEALIRWNDPKHGFRLPSTFLEVAEKSDLIVRIGEWVLRDVCRTIANNALGVPIALNLSINQFNKKNQFLKILSEVLDEFQIDYNKLEFEITESILMNGTENISILTAIQKMGIKIAFDDFGIGYSSFNYLKYFTPNRVKIDKSFIDGIPNIPSSVAIVKAIITICKSMDLRTTAEGAETEEQLNFLIEQGCDEIQSFYFSRPLPFLEVQAIINKDFRDLIPNRK